jgi:hypothetical protein
MAEFSQKLYGVLKARGWDQQKGGKDLASKELGVSRASFYNYLNRKDLAGLEVQRRAHDLWGVKSDYINFGHTGSPPASAIHEDKTRQYVLPFIQSVRENDIEIVRTKPIRPDTLQLTVNIKFAG